MVLLLSCESVSVLPEKEERHAHDCGLAIETRSKIGILTSMCRIYRISRIY